ncbi:hypothetical protein FRC03_010469 [Tulasnella sp. 419]|nr:hypothetical protein FRC02_009745 [Tulasnella sp. 418]KAG8967225.1 hypothetical protein FRC03_010469 [Tulasnella sp. 419]
MASKKNSKPAPAEVDYKVRDIVLAKVRGYPAWPAMVVDPDNVPKEVKREKPPNKKLKFYCVRFFPAGDHYWSLAKDLSRLLPHEIEAYISEPSKKNGDLKRGYEIALNPEAWEKEFQKRLEEKQRQEEEIEESVDQLDESEGADDEPDAEGEAADDGETTSKKKKKSDAGKKRKRESTSADDKKKKKKSTSEGTSGKRRPVVNKKKKLSAEHIESEDEDKADATASTAQGEDDIEEDADKADPTPARKPKSRRAKKEESTTETPDRPAKRAKKDKAEDEDVEDAALANDPEAQRVKEWRHKLQRGFLTNKSPPVAEDMPTYDQIFSTVETYEGLTIQYLSFSKIGKVMRRIAQLPEIPRDEEFKFKERAMNLVLKWQGMVVPENGTSNGAGESHPNGVESKMEIDKEDASKQESKETGKEAIVNGTEEAKVNGTAPAATSSAEEAPATTTSAPDVEMKTKDAEGTKDAEQEKPKDSDAMDISQS